MIRLFAAITPPESVRLRLAALCAGVPGAKWSKPDNLHLTLRFIGDVDGRTFGDIVDTLGQVAIQRFSLHLDGVGHFGEGRRVDTLWAGVKPNENLMRLQGKIETALQRLGLDPERRKFHPHITLARLRGAREERVAQFLVENGGFLSLAFPVEQYTLFSSYLARSGAIHQPEAVYPLK
jgi:RNA 2',3'-cyclic 3'-phosphodiesterase